MKEIVYDKCYTVDCSKVDGGSNDLFDKLRNELITNGYVKVKCENISDENCDKACLDTINKVGGICCPYNDDPTAFIWPVKVLELDSPKSKLQASQLDRELVFHTDCSYEHDAPRFVALYFVQCDRTENGVYGGLSTIVGSAATVFLKGYVDEQYANTNFRLTFLNYLLLTLPTVVLMMISCWLWLQIRFNYHGLIQSCCSRNSMLNARDEHLKQTLRRQYNELGPLQWKEGVVAILFLSAIVLWITRDLAGNGSGWGSLMSRNAVSNGTVALLMAVLTMILPNEKPHLNDWKYNPIIPWIDLSKNYPWGTLLMLGAGLSIAQAFQVY
ncbi:unnamed protein product [Adineta steineri]|uniref:Uncharacterized protein n=1 Tax=Adineta steineri TaxID=433720 RepID=A0A813UJ24_9BILA|nr:unnamed protein product [Adineta steineri]